VNQYFTAARVVAQTDLVTVMPRHFVPISHMAESCTLPSCRWT
jgi:hypothetical protein